MPQANQSIPSVLELFGGQNSDVAAIDLPEGLSPSCQDVAFLPGSVFTRPALSKLYTTSGNSVPINYVKTFLNQNLDPITLFITGADATAHFGQLWMEDVLNNPGVAVFVGPVSLGAMARSTTTDNREYISFTDGTQGTFIPASFDGANFLRISQDGPGAPPAISDYNPTINITASPNGLLQQTTSTISSITASSGFITVFLTGNVPAGAQNGDLVKISGTGVVDGTFTITGLYSTYFTFSIANGTFTHNGGTVTWALIDVIPTSAVANLTVGATATIAGSGVAGYNAAWTIRNVVSSTDFQIYTGTFTLGNSGNGTVVVTGSSSSAGVTAGLHRFVVMFETSTGYITKPSPIGSWTAAGSFQALVNSLPLGPPNVVARIIALTQAGGSKYTYIPSNVTVGSISGGIPTLTNSTVIRDNTTTSVILDFSDAELSTGLAIDIQGNDLFAQVTSGLPVGIYQYSNRLILSGDSNQVTNFTNMGFNGGVLSLTPPLASPLWWVVASAGGALVTGTAPFQWQWQITGDGTASQKGKLSQSAYQDYLGVQILLPSTKYSLRLWLQASQAGLSGQFTASISSASTGFSTTASINANAVSTSGAFYTISFNLSTPAVIPSDMQFSIYATSVNNAQALTVADMHMLYAANPILTDRLRVSYILNPEAFDGETGLIIPPHPEQPIVGCFEFRDQLYILKSGSLYTTSDIQGGDNTEPEGWSIQLVSGSIGAMSFRSFDVGEDWVIIADKSGAFIFSGGQPLKISQEVQAIWDTINPAAYNTVWVKNDRATRRLYFGLPTGSATSPNKILVMDYRELKSAQDITYSDPEHVAYSGKVISTDLARKWTIWNIPANSGEVIFRQNSVEEMALGGGGGTGLTTGGFNNVYRLSTTKFTDDDYGKISSFYTTYFFLPKFMQQQMQMVGLCLYDYMRMFVSGIGNLQLTFYGNALSNAWPLPPVLPLQSGPIQDYELALNVQTERIAVKFSVNPLPGQTDAYFQLNKVVMMVRQSPLAVRGVF